MKVPHVWRALAALAVLTACTPDLVSPPPAAVAVAGLSVNDVMPPDALPDGELVTLTFFINHADCSGLSTQFVFKLNGVTLGTNNTTSPCACNADELQVSFAGPDARSAWNAAVGGPNTIEVAVSNQIHIGYIRLAVVTSHGSATVRLFDAISGGNAQPRDLCQGLVFGRQVFEKTFPDLSGTIPNGSLVSLTFHVNHADCDYYGMTAAIEFLVNDTVIGSSGTTASCICNDQELSVTFTGPDAQAAWHAGGPNTIAVRLRTGQVAVGYVRIDVQTTGGAVTRALFDALGDGDARTRGLCQGYTWNYYVAGGLFSRSFAGFETNRPPTANAGADQMAECVRGGADVTLDGSASADPDHDALTYDWLEGGSTIASGATPTIRFANGVHTVTLRVTDTHAATSEDEVMVTVADTRPPVVNLSVTSPQLWPPNHTMQRVAAGVAASDECDAVPNLVVTVTSNEAENGLGDGDTAPDWQVMDNHDGTFDVWVRAERAGGGIGRVYTISAVATDASGNGAVRTATVTVPKSQAKK